MIMITGATGNIGRELARELAAKGITFRALVRDLSRAATLPEEAERVVGDLGKQETLAPAFEGIEKLFLLTQGIGTDYAACAVDAAKAADVKHIVLVSSYSVLSEPLPAMAYWHHKREEIVRSSGIPATFLRPGGFMTNAFDWLPSIREGGFVIDAIGPGRYAPIDPSDIGAVAANVLTTAGHEDIDYALTGDEVFTIAEQVQIISEIAGCTLEVREAATADDLIKWRFPNGAPQALEDALVEGVRLMRADTVGFRTDTVERLLGRKPRSFRDWSARNADAFRQAYKQYEDRRSSEIGKE